METTIRENIKRIIELIGLTFIELSKEVNLHPKYIGRVLNGTRPMTSNFLLKMTEYFNISIEELSTGFSPEREAEFIKLGNEKFLKELIGENRFAELDPYRKELLLSNIQDIHKHINDFCTFNHITHSELSKATDISINTFQNYMYNTRYTNSCSAQTYKTIAKSLGVSIENFILGVPQDVLYKNVINILPDVGKNIIQFRLDNKLTLLELSKLSQIKFKTLESYSYGKRKLSINALKSISSTFNISPEEFLFKNIDLAKNIKIFCILNGLTQQELANSSNVSSTLLNAFLTGKHCIPNIIYIERIAKGLNISLEQLILGVPTEVEEVVLNPVKIGQNVRMILKERNMTFQQLADLSTLSIRTVSKFINGKHFGVYSLSSIANALNLPIKDIICYGLAIQEEFMDELVV